ncbi:MAG: glycoside hydrolase family 31 protein [Paludibacter sp.]
MKFKQHFITCIILIFFTAKSFAGNSITELILQPGEKVWAGVINDGHLMPFSKDYSMDLFGENKTNQTQPLLLTSKGQFVWSEEPFQFEVTNSKVIITDKFKKVQTGQHGTTLAEVQRFVSNKYFHASGSMPDSLLITAPQYNTWIELNYHHNQADILKYAHAIIDNGMPPGVFMIDDTWQEDYGLWDFHPGRFPNPKKMIDELHSLGFKVMLWVCPFVSADQKLIYYHLKDRKAFLLEKKNEKSTWENSTQPLMVEWWNGVSAELDFSNPEGVKWFNDQLDRLVKDYKIDGFKFDAADFPHYPQNALSKVSLTPNAQSELYTQFGLRFPFNEYRACWKMGGQPLAQRLLDKNHTWEDLRILIPQIIVQGLSGYTFCCPDMIGGGMLSSFENGAKIDQDLIVRSAQCQALMPMMQFSVAPWRVLDSIHFQAVKNTVKLREKFTPYIMKLAKESAINGEPIVKNMEFVFPNQGFESIADQFMLGDKLLVAPMLENTATRKVTLPKGKWKSDEGKMLNGGKIYEISVSLNRLPYFEKIK